MCDWPHELEFSLSLSRILCLIMQLTFFDDLNDVALFEGEFIGVCCIIVVECLAEWHVGFGGWRRLLASPGRWPGAVEWSGVEWSNSQDNYDNELHSSKAWWWGCIQ